MSRRTTYADLKASRIPAVLNVCATDPRLLAWANEAQERLLNRGLWWGTYGKFRICANDGCLTMPPQIATLEAVAIQGRPVPIHDSWFEFLENGIGTRNSCDTGSCANCGTSNGWGGCSLPEALYRGQYPIFEDVIGGTSNSPKRLRFICDVADDVGETVTVLGYDNNGNWIRTKVGAIWRDGETVTLSQSPGSATTKYFSAITDIQFSGVRDGQVWLYEYDTVALTNRMIGTYQYWETHPSYARYYLPSIHSSCTSTSTTTPTTTTAGETITDDEDVIITDDEDVIITDDSEVTEDDTLSVATISCTPSAVEIIGKLAFIPIRNDSDYPIIGCLPALKFMMQSVKKFEQAVNPYDVQEALAFETKAMQELEFELDHHLGSGRRMGMTVQGSLGPSNEPIEILI